jgi:hypothetical protein
MIRTVAGGGFSGQKAVTRVGRPVGRTNSSVASALKISIHGVRATKGPHVANAPKAGSSVKDIVAGTLSSRGRVTPATPALDHPKPGDCPRTSVTLRHAEGLHWRAAGGPANLPSIQASKARRRAE